MRCGTEAPPLPSTVTALSNFSFLTEEDINALCFSGSQHHRMLMKSPTAVSYYYIISRCRYLIRKSSDMGKTEIVVACCPGKDQRLSPRRPQDLHSLPLSTYHHTGSGPQRNRFRSLILQHYENRPFSV